MLDAAVRWDADVVHGTSMLASLRDDTPDNMLKMSDGDWCVLTPERPAVTEETLITDSPEALLARWMRHELHWSAWNKLYRRSMLLEHHIQFGKMRLAEDQQFCFCCLFWARRYVRIPGAGYCYRQA